MCAPVVGMSPNILQHLLAWGRQPSAPGALGAPFHPTAVVSVACRGVALLSRSEKETETFKAGKPVKPVQTLHHPPVTMGVSRIVNVWGDGQGPAPSLRGRYGDPRVYLHQ